MGMRPLSAGTTLVGSDPARVDLVFSDKDITGVHCELHVVDRQVALAPFPDAIVSVDGVVTTKPLMLPASTCVILGAAGEVELLITQGDPTLAQARALTVEELLSFFPAHVASATSSQNESYFFSESEGGSAPSSVEVRREGGGEIVRMAAGNGAV